MKSSLVWRKRRRTIITKPSYHHHHLHTFVFTCSIWRMHCIPPRSQNPVCDSTSATGQPHSSYWPVHARWTIFAFFRSRCRHQYFLNGVHETNGNGNGYLLDHIFCFYQPVYSKKKENMNLTRIERPHLLSYFSMPIRSIHWEWSWGMILFLSKMAAFFAVSTTVWITASEKSSS